MLRNLGYNISDSGKFFFLRPTNSVTRCPKLTKALPKSKVCVVIPV